MNKKIGISLVVMGAIITGIVVYQFAQQQIAIKTINDRVSAYQDAKQKYDDCVYKWQHNKDTGQYSGLFVRALCEPPK